MIFGGSKYIRENFPMGFSYVFPIPKKKRTTWDFSRSIPLRRWVRNLMIYIPIACMLVNLGSAVFINETAASPNVNMVWYLGGWPNIGGMEFFFGGLDFFFWEAPNLTSQFWKSSRIVGDFDWFISSRQAIFHSMFFCCWSTAHFLRFGRLIVHPEVDNAGSYPDHGLYWSADHSAWYHLLDQDYSSWEQDLLDATLEVKCSLKHWNAGFGSGTHEDWGKNTHVTFAWKANQDFSRTVKGGEI